MAPPKISLMKYILGSTSIDEMRAAYGMPPKNPTTTTTTTKKQFTSKPASKSKPKSTPTSPTSKDTKAKTPPDDTKDAKAKTPAAADDSNKDAKETKDTPPTNKHNFTPSQDALLKELVAKRKNGEPWNVTGEKVGKAGVECKERWKELEGGGGGGASKPKTKEEAEKPKDTTPKDAKPDKTTNSKSDKSSTTTIELTPDADFTLPELLVLAELMREDREGVWLRVASAFWDRTGRRLHPEDVRGKFGG